MMPKASFPSPPSPKNVGSFLLGECPHRAAGLQYQLRLTAVGCLGSLPELKGVIHFFTSISPARMGIQGSGLCLPNSLLEAQCPAGYLARGQL